LDNIEVDEAILYAAWIEWKIRCRKTIKDYKIDINFSPILQ